MLACTDLLDSLGFPRSHRPWGRHLQLEDHRSNLSHWGLWVLDLVPWKHWVVPDTCQCAEAGNWLYTTSAPVYSPCWLYILAWVRPTSIYSGCWQTPRAPVAAGISLTHGCPQPNSLPWAMHLTQGSTERVGTGSTNNLQKLRHACIGQVRLSIVKNWEQICCPRGVSSWQWGYMWQSSTIQHFLPIRAEMKWWDEVSLLILPLAKWATIPRPVFNPVIYFWSLMNSRG